MIKDVADLFAAEGEGARETIEGLRDRAKDALDVAVAEAPGGSARERYRYAREHLFPLLLRLEDPGERSAALNDVAEALSLPKRDLRKVFSNLEEEAQDEPEEERGEHDLAPEPGSERYERAIELLECPDVLSKAAEDMERLGHVGERNTKQLAFVCAVSAKAGSPIQPSTHAQSSSGKNFLWDRTLGFLPPEMVVRRSGLTAKALFRTRASLQGVVLYIQEVVGSEDADFSIRVLQSDGRLVYEATETMPDGSIGTVVYTKEGPCVVVQTTTNNHLHPENESRVFPLYIDESEEQTRRIIRSTLQDAAGGGMSTEEREAILTRWRDAVRLLEPAEVIVPYAERIELPSFQIRIRRDVRRLLDVVRVRAWLHQRRRERDDKDRVLASEEDFYATLELVEDSLSRAWQALTPAEEKVLEAVKGLPERKRREGFKRKDLRVAGVSDQRAKEVLRSLAGTGYLDCDERKGPQGYTYTLAREAQKRDLGISLRPSSDDGESPANEEETTGRGRDTRHRAASDAEDGGEANGLSDDTGRNADRPIETPDLQEERAIGRSDGGQTEEDILGKGEQRVDDAQDDWRDAYHREMERRFGPDWQSDSPGTRLKKLGWARVEDWAPRDRDEVGDAWDAEHEPVAREILDAVCIHMRNSRDTQWYDVWIALDGELASLWDEHGSEEGQEGSDSTGSSTSPREIRDHMARLLPTLQTERLFLDPELTLYYGYESRRSLTKGYVYVERWENESGKEGLWFCVALKPGQHVPDEEVEDYLWWLVSSIEGLTERHFAPEGVPVFDDF